MLTMLMMMMMMMLMMMMMMINPLVHLSNLFLNLMLLVCCFFVEPPQDVQGTCRLFRLLAIAPLALLQVPGPGKVAVHSCPYSCSLRFIILLGTLFKADFASLRCGNHGSDKDLSWGVGPIMCAPLCAGRVM